MTSRAQGPVGVGLKSSVSKAMGSGELVLQDEAKGEAGRVGRKLEYIFYAVIIYYIFRVSI